MLGTPEKVVLLTDANYATKVNPSQKYPACEVDTANLFDEDSDPIFTLEPPSSDTAAASTPTTSKTKKVSKAAQGLKEHCRHPVPSAKHLKTSTCIN